MSRKGDVLTKKDKFVLGAMTLVTAHQLYTGHKRRQKRLKAKNMKDLNTWLADGRMKMTLSERRKYMAKQRKF